MASSNAEIEQIGNADVSMFTLDLSGPIRALAVVTLDSTGGIAAAGSTTITVRQSTAGDLKVQVEPGAGSLPIKAGDQTAGQYLPVRIVDSSGTGFAGFGLDYTDGSTTSTLAAAGFAFNNSSANTMRLVGSTTPLPTYTADSTGRAVPVSTSSTTANNIGMNIWAQLPACQSTTILVLTQTAGGSTTLISSVAAKQHRVYAFSVTSTLIATSSATFASSANDRWGLLVGTGSSGVSGGNLAVSPPGFLFTTETASALTFVTSSTGLYRVSVSFFTE